MDDDQSNLRRLDLTLLMIFSELVRQGRATAVAIKSDSANQPSATRSRAFGVYLTTNFLSAAPTVSIRRHALSNWRR